jgi:aryl-alcohol dehydrogenase-like predicted oxidoreductase
VEARILGRTGRAVSVIGLGTWQLGADWGDVEDADALAVLAAAAESGITFLDTADVYGDGRSERLIGQFLAGNPGLDIMVATKMGRRVELDPALYTLDNFRAWTDRSRANLGTDRLDLVQLHCPPSAVYSLDAVYDALDTLVAQQRVAAYGVSVETCADALTAIARPGTASVQIILNAFRRKPLEQVLPAAQAAGSASSPASPWPRGCCRAGTGTTRSSPRTTIAAITAMARRSTPGRPSRASTSTPGWTRPVSLPRWRPRASPRRGPPCAGWSSSQGSAA